MSATVLENSAQSTADLGVLPSWLDAGIGWRTAIGLIVLASDQTMEHEFRKLIKGDGIAVYASRLFNDNDITPATLRAIGPRIAPATGLILPGIDLNVIGFGCTSATVELGEEAVFGEIRRARPGIACTTPITAAFAAFRAFRARRIALLTPYAPEINARFVAYLRGQGIETVAMATFDRRDDRDAARISLPRWPTGFAPSPRSGASRRCSCPAPASGSPRSPTRSSVKPASRSHPARTRWRGIA